MNSITHLDNLSQLEGSLTELHQRYNEIITRKDVSEKADEPASGTLGKGLVQGIAIDLKDEWCTPERLRLCLYMNSWWHANKFAKNVIELHVWMEDPRCRCKCHLATFDQLASKVEQLVKKEFQGIELQIKTRRPCEPESFC